MNEAAAKKAQKMADEIWYLVTRYNCPVPAEDLKCALEKMAKAVGLLTDVDKEEAPEFAEAFVAQAHEAIVRRRAKNYVQADFKVGSGC